MKNCNIYKILLVIFVFTALLYMAPTTVYANNSLIPQVNVSVGGTDDPEEVVSALQVLFLVSIIALAPSILVLLTGFTRIIIAMHFVRSAMGAQQMPPNQVLVGVALVLTLFLMAPMITEINDNALQPFGRGEISMEEALELGMAPLSQFMRNQAETRDVALFASLAGDQVYESVEDIPNSILIPAFILGELTKGFLIGFVMYMPFIVIDMVVASILMAMGMMMLPPAMISLPFKILLFLLAGGWSFILEYVMNTFVM